ncbi:hypothetical protein B0A48_05119 [Cryoendolithus antarcticus]|uniref:Metallo-beta-lactamase domain-containing protein n=1 Tax=Cryoendolithus antarcticus TaxID=1507870 RepID=A0A1V8TEB7_9PEZI|nr:hypothetical protein B0A48_05119 [Cryoendolithus antarcticus]
MTPSYSVSRLNSTTHLVIHNDKFFEFPYIYVKVYGNLKLAVIIDTGCGASSTKGTRGQTDLKTCIEENVLSTSRDEKQWSFLVICTHCHFDHIGGIESFADDNASIVASGFDRDFISPVNLPKNSFCKAFGVDTPKFKVTHFADDNEHLSHSGHDLGLTALHTPGHTPDSLAIYDVKERWLFTGDTFYQRAATMPWAEKQDVPILFPPQGNWHDWCASLEKLLRLSKAEDAGNEKLVRVACGHTTSDAVATATVERVIDFGKRIAAGKVREVMRLPGKDVAPGGSLGDEIFVYWHDEGDVEFSMMAPERFLEDFGRIVLETDL